MALPLSTIVLEVGVTFRVTERDWCPLPPCPRPSPLNDEDEARFGTFEGDSHTESQADAQSEN